VRVFSVSPVFGRQQRARGESASRLSRLQITLGYRDDPARNGNADEHATNTDLPRIMSAAIVTNTSDAIVECYPVEQDGDGWTASGVSGTFNFAADCSADGQFSGPVSLTNATSGTGSIANVPSGATCAVSESATLPPAPTNYTWAPCRVRSASPTSANHADREFHQYADPTDQLDHNSTRA